MSAISVKNITKTYGKGDGAVTALKDASFEIQTGEMVALLGPSGSGKTTLLTILGCVLEPTGGELHLDNIEVYNGRWKIKDARRLRREKIGFIFQSHYLIPFLNVEENVTLIPRANGIKKDDAIKKAKQLLEYLDIADKMKNKISELSGGQSQRVAIARSLANEPKIILADEPTAALDSERAVSVIKLLQKIAKSQNVAIVVVTHDERLLSYFDRILRINDGVVSEEA
ncbi:MAG: putative transport system ATP-binding protein [Campylobacterota bacterium]|nr:putative transport system ATP-binding protein [Campylobacterota bacterium]